ncbi:MAG TPA: hypothetical protein VFL61_00510 [Gaiellaceae bacterium]|nr:hypothetical protein [Gaiellaceae bacterium]
MSEHDTDSFYWEPDPDFPLKQGDLLLNVPLALMPSQPEFVVRPPGAGEAQIVPTDGFPDYAPTTEIVAEARFGALSMVITPTCHVSEGEKDEDVVAVVPVEPLRVVVPNRDSWEQIKKRAATRPHHLFYLPPTERGGGVLVFDAVAQLDRPGSFLKHELRNYRRLGLYRDARYELRKQLARFWPRVTADELLDRDLQAKIDNNVPLDKIE